MTKVLNALVLVIALIFAGLGFRAAVNTHAFLVEYELAGAGAKGISEVRCFFGGHFLAWTVMILVGFMRPELRRGTWIAAGIGLTLVGVLRVPAILLDGAVEFNVVALVAELLFAAILFAASRNAPRPA